MKKIYICGKISGMEEQAKILFEEAERHLIEKGYEVVNPMKLPHKHDKKWSSYMRECIKALCDCDSIYLLENWRESKGAKIEFQIAFNLELVVVF